MINWSTLLQHYGYLAILVGTFFEGETVLLLGAYAVNQHILNFWLLIATAMIGSFIGDQFYYHMGRKYGYDFISRRPKLERKFQQASLFVEYYPTLSILLMRFAWGLRTVIPISFG
ncbi:DedA family protein, partial [Acinetobacter terrae]|uniref:DedA family protein n=1 Tax=Acinetobacter terrae TaxID=2731247 RepID=UPI001489BC7F